MAKLDMFKKEKGLVEVPAGEVIFEAGAAADNMFVVVEGEVEISKDGRVLDTAGPGDAVGEMALIEERARAATVTASSDVKIALISKARFEYLVSQHPFFALDVMEQMADRLRRQTSA